MVAGLGRSCLKPQVGNRVRERSGRACLAGGVCSLDDALLPDVDVRWEAVEFTAEVLVVVAASCGPPPECLGCRSLAEQSLSGRSCWSGCRSGGSYVTGPTCRRRTFAEQVSGLGEGLCRRMHLAAGRTRLLALLDLPTVKEAAPDAVDVADPWRRACLRKRLEEVTGASRRYRR